MNLLSKSKADTLLLITFVKKHPNFCVFQKIVKTRHLFAISERCQPKGKIPFGFGVYQVSSMRVSKDPSQSDEVLNNRHCLHFDAKLYTNTLNSQNFDHIFWKKSVFHFTRDCLDRNIQHQRTMSMYKGRTVRHQN